MENKTQKHQCLHMIVCARVYKYIYVYEQERMILTRYEEQKHYKKGYFG